jgi:ribosomal protein L7/L12
MDSLTIVSIVIPLLAVIYFTQTYIDNKKIQQIQRRQIRLEQTLQHIMKHLDIEPQESDKADIMELLIHGDKISAIKLARERFGYSLLEAKEYVDQLENPSEK